MPRSKAQIARSMYGTSLSSLSAGQKAAVTRAFNNQTTTPARQRTTTRRRGDEITVKFTRPHVSAIRNVVCSPRTTVFSAVKQADMGYNPAKEGLLKETGELVLHGNDVEDGVVYVITPGVDSSN